MSIFAYHTTQIGHVYEPFYLVVYDHSEKPVGGYVKLRYCSKNSQSRIIKCKSSRLRLEAKHVNFTYVHQSRGQTSQRVFIAPASSHETIKAKLPSTHLMAGIKMGIGLFHSWPHNFLCNAEILQRQESKQDVTSSLEISEALTALAVGEKYLFLHLLRVER